MVDLVACIQRDLAIFNLSVAAPRANATVPGECICTQTRKQLIALAAVLTQSPDDRGNVPNPALQGHAGDQS